MNDNDIRITLFDDQPQQIDNIRTSLLPFADSDLNATGPWPIRLGDDVITVHCRVISDPSQVMMAFSAGLKGQILEQTDLILLDNDWEQAQSGDRFGLDVLSKANWQRGAGPMLAIYTIARTYQPTFVRDALRYGADALIYKRESTHFLNILLTVIARKNSANAALKLRRLGGLLSEQDPGLISVSSAMQKLLQEAALVAPWRNESVLILGEVGTGKTRLAEAIHKCSPRADFPFVTLDPSHIGETLIHAELFGARRGAYTGAVVNRRGIIDSANGGTLFIDEFENMSVGMQELMLRVIENRKFTTPGDPEEHRVDIRFVFATNESPEQLVAAGKLRADLYSRIDQNILYVPPLRERSEDVPGLVESFVREFYRENLPGQPTPVVTTTAITLLQREVWPDNVRGLRNAIRRSLVRLPPSTNLDPEHLLLRTPDATSYAPIETEAVLESDIESLLRIAPRPGSLQRKVYDCLLGASPNLCPTEDLNEAIGQPRTPTASDSLILTITRLRGRLEPRGFSITQKRDAQGYVLVRTSRG